MSGQRGALLRAFGPIVAAAEDEAGTVVYGVHEDNAEADVLWFYEEYTDDEAFATHRNSDTFARARPAIHALLAAPPEINLLTVVRAKRS